MPNSAPDPSVHWRTYTEARADFDRQFLALESRIRETEQRIMARLDSQDRGFERGADHQRDTTASLELRTRKLEQDVGTLQSQELAKAVERLSQEVTVLRTTNRLLAAVGGAVMGILGLALTAVAIWKN